MVPSILISVFYRNYSRSEHGNYLHQKKDIRKRTITFKKNQTRRNNTNNADRKSQSAVSYDRANPWMDLLPLCESSFIYSPQLWPLLRLSDDVYDCNDVAVAACTERVVSSVKGRIVKLNLNKFPCCRVCLCMYCPQRNTDIFTSLNRNELIT